MFLHCFIDIYQMQDRRTNFTAIMINICFLLFIPWRTFAYGTFILMWPWKEADHRSNYISRVILTFFVEYYKVDVHPFSTLFLMHKTKKKFGENNNAFNGDVKDEKNWCWNDKLISLTKENSVDLHYNIYSKQATQ